MNYHHSGPIVGIPMPYFYEPSQSSVYQNPSLAFVNDAQRLPPVTETPRLLPPIDTYKTNAVNVGFVIHSIELEAYAAVLKAFKIQSDLLSWGKEGLITELRKELNVTDLEHRTLLTHINSDKSIKMMRDLQQGVFHTRELPSNITHAPTSAPCSVYCTPQHSAKFSGADSTMQKYVAHSQPIPANFPPLPFQNWDGFRNGQLPAYPTRNTEKPMRVVTPSVKNHYESKVIDPKKTHMENLIYVAPSVKDYFEGKFKSPRQPHKKNLIHVAEVHNFKNNSGIIHICATETVLSKVQNMVFGREIPGTDQVEMAKSMLMKQERAILEALAKLADEINEDESPNRHQEQTEAREKLSIMGKRTRTVCIK